MIDLVQGNETYEVIGACIQVHKKLGNRFSKEIYQEALVKELEKKAIPFEQQKKLAVYYEGKKLNNHSFAEFVCFDTIILEIKSIKFLDTITKQQTLNYLKSTNYEVGLLINFGENSLTWKRFIHTPVS